MVWRKHSFFFISTHQVVPVTVLQVYWRELYTCYLIDEIGQIELVFNFGDEADYAVAKAIWVSLERGDEGY